MIRICSLLRPKHSFRRFPLPGSLRQDCISRKKVRRFSAVNESLTPKETTLVVEKPTAQQLRIVALRAAIPMIGFGFMDNLVMITAGDAIDAHFGETLAISTMAAAGFGQCCSDVAGVTSGGIVDSAISKLRLPVHGLSQAQLDLRITRMYSTFGACAGVLTGCLLGMSILMFMDTGRVDRAKKAKELESIFDSVVKEGAKLLHAERATLFLIDDEKQELWSQVATGTEGIIKLPVSAGIVGACVTSQKLINIQDAYSDNRFFHNVDDKTGFHTKSILVIPVNNENGKAIGAIEMINKKNPDGSDGAFGDNDEKLIEMLASHVKSFIRIVNGGDE